MSVEFEGRRRLALGINAYLDDFALSHDAITWKVLVPSDPEVWKDVFLQFMNDPDVLMLFNPEGVDVWGGVTKAAAGRGGATDWELLQIQQSPTCWGRILWFMGVHTATNPCE